VNIRAAARRLPTGGQEFLQQLAAGDIHIAIGTHALLEDDVISSAGLVVVDEQQKSASRSACRCAQSRSPHVLVMTPRRSGTADADALWHLGCFGH